ncbi:hypothetical protein VOLCADRAFT_96771 [Volvox carteri f. nagariensis]|uniref:Protein kinase domain-containing protein n=1 Tax=Volvox carteri f. nagariensis TaxID=3068 RepID=D8UB04_VOLCA|nr:uncharacterized protein VOLCADRAFT_96771 [Volvox carteri f. nagariensis]EFJ43027.1 hypothetical protein VOLCADRAFT_96771 [Volvox carteri f. nagariensis]|eukprot:XP_002955826.1 hypothetical protein VOLCADRAFT_96771 [Volvox carteri f. nagariensis]
MSTNEHKQLWLSQLTKAKVTSTPLKISKGLPDYKRRFLELLSLGNIQRPKTAVLNLIMRRCPARVMVLGDCNDAVDLYREALLFPGPSTERHLLTQHGLRVNGPLFPNPAEGSMSLLIGATCEGLPVIVKLLAQGSSTDSDQQPGGAEAEACRALIESKPASVPLVPARVITFKLGAEHMSNVDRVPGLYAALCMPRYVSSLALMVPLPAAAVLAGGRRMAAALEWIHEKEYTHMDVKADNIFVDSKGRWWLGDFGSTVRTGSPVTSTTIIFAPCMLLGLPAKPQYDWHMLAVVLVCEMNRNNWKELLIKGSCSPPENLIVAIKELHRLWAMRFIAQALMAAGCEAPSSVCHGRGTCPGRTGCEPPCILHQPGTITNTSKAENSVKPPATSDFFSFRAGLNLFQPK